MAEKSSKNVKFELKRDQMIKWKEEFRCLKCQKFLNPLKNGEEILRCKHSESHCACQNCAKHTENLCWIPGLDEAKFEPMPEATLFFVRKMWKDFPKFCENESDGCDQILMENQMKKHEKNWLD